MGGYGSGRGKRTEAARAAMRRKLIAQGKPDFDELARKYNQEHPFVFEETSFDALAEMLKPDRKVARLG